MNGGLSALREAHQAVYTWGFNLFGELGLGIVGVTACGDTISYSVHR